MVKSSDKVVLLLVTVSGFVVITALLILVRSAGWLEDTHSVPVYRTDYDGYEDSDAYNGVEEEIPVFVASVAMQPLADSSLSDSSLPESPPPTAPALSQSSLYEAPSPVPDTTVPLWQRNAVRNTANPHWPRVVIVIDDLGVNRSGSERAVALPTPLTLSWLSYAPALPEQTATARQRGHELLLHLPMEPMSEVVDPGPGVLRVDDPTGVTLSILAKGLAQFDGYVGVNNHMGSRFTSSASALRPVLQEIHHRGLLFLDSRTSAQSMVEQLTAEIQMPFIRRNVFIDHNPSEPAIRKQLAEVERLARENGSVIAIAHPHTGTLNVLTEWLPTLVQKKLALVPLSALVKHSFNVAMQ